MAVGQEIILGINVVWFGLAFRLFALRSRAAVKLLVPDTTRHENSRAALVATLPFLGGMNLGLAVLSALYLGVGLTHAHAPLLWPVFAASSVAHASQLAANVPLALRGGRGGGAPWDVLRGPMCFIFVVDGLAALANAVAAALGA